MKKSKKLKLVLPRQLTAPIKKSNIVIKIINHKIGYLKIPNWSPQEIISQLIDQKLSWFKRKSIKALIIDVRGNYGGDSRLARGLAGHFFEQQVSFGAVKQRLKNSTLHLENIKLLVEPQLPYYSWSIILLVDAGCFSSNEYFIAGLKDNKRAYVIGEATGGGSGNPKKFVIPFKNESFDLWVSTWRYIRPNGQALEGGGISPNLVIHKTLDDVIQAKDRVLEVAIKKIIKM
jgi:carboxyl-terminal processing protease